MILQAYILSWYPRFTKDRSLLPQIHQNILRPILTPILSGIYEHPERLAEFLLLDLPTILALHVETYWSARASVASGVIGRGEEKLSVEKEVGKAYHARLPLLSVEFPKIPNLEERSETDVYELSPLYLTSLADALLRLYLPPAEYGTNVERLIAREVLGRSVLGSVGKRLGQGWFWWSIMLKSLGKPGSDTKLSEQAREEKNIIPDMLLNFFSRLRPMTMIVWTMASVIAILSTAPLVQVKYRGVADPWLRLGREVLGIDGRAGLERTFWRRRLVWGVVEMALGLFGSVLDR